MKITKNDFVSNLKADDLRDGARLCSIATVEKNDYDKFVLYVDQFEETITLNKGNLRWMATTFGDDTDKWIGQWIVVYRDPSVMYEGKPVGGIALRKPKPDFVPPKREVAEAAVVPASADTPF